MNKTLILVVEDDRPIRNLIVTTLKTHDYKYLAAENGFSLYKTSQKYVFSFLPGFQVRYLPHLSVLSCLFYFYFTLKRGDLT